MMNAAYVVVTTVHVKTVQVYLMEILHWMTVVFVMAVMQMILDVAVLNQAHLAVI